MTNINSADIKELQQISGIGQITAENIVQYRDANGGFDSLDELKNVSGIGPKSFASLKDKITLNEAESDEKELVRVEFDQSDYELEGVEIDEVHLVGDMNDWDPTDKTYALELQDDNIWANSFDLEAGLEYKIMYDSTSWEEDKHVGFYGGNLRIEE